MVWRRFRKRRALPPRLIHLDSRNLLNPTYLAITTAYQTARHLLGFNDKEPATETEATAQEGQIWAMVEEWLPEEFSTGIELAKRQRERFMPAGPRYTPASKPTKRKTPQRSS